MSDDRLKYVVDMANQIALNLSSMTFMFAMGLAVVATIRVGNQFGLKDFSELRRIARSLFLLILIVSSCGDGDLQIETIDFDSVTIKADDLPSLLRL